MHWHWRAHDLGEDEHGRWLYAPTGTPFRRGNEAERIAGQGFVKLVRPSAWWTAVWNDEPGQFEVYVDIITPPVWDDARVSMVDLDLDVVRTIVGDVAVLDEDEFAEHRAAMAYPDHVVAAARSATAWVAMRLEDGSPPFGAEGQRWLDVGRQRFGP